jgi:hypothetical protein
MRCRVVHLACVIAALAGLPLLAAQIRPQPGMTAAPTSPATSGTAAIFGRVLDASSDAPVVGAVVLIGGLPGTGPSGGPALPSTTAGQITAMTNARGQFLFHDLPAGSYTLTVRAPGYLAGAYGQRRPQGSSRRVAVADGQQTLDADVRLWKTAAITGAVLDELGEPVVQVNVRALRRTFARGRPRWSQTTTATTDDRGIYRLAGLMPGDYVVAMPSSVASVPASTADAYWQAAGSEDQASRTTLSQIVSSGAISAASGVWSGNQRVRDVSGPPLPPSADPNAPLFIYPRTFYPATENQDDASIVTVSSGEERQAIDLRIRPVRTFRVSGIVTGPTGPTPNARLTLSPASASSVQPMSAYADVGMADTAFTTSTTATDASGQFTFVGAPPGEYILRAMVAPQRGGQIVIVDGVVTSVSAPPAGTASVDPLSAELSVGVADRDVTGLTLTMQPGASVSGTIVFASGTTPPTTADLTRARISLTETVGQTRIGGDSRTPDTRGHFELAPAPRGTYAFSIALPTWTIKSVRIGGKEIGDGLFSLTTDVDDVVVTLTNRLAGLAGTVQRSGVDAAVAIFPADFQNWIASGMSSSRARLVDADKNGTFDVDGLVGGDYAVAAIDASTSVDLQNPADIEALARIATRVTLGDGDRKTLSLAIGRLH